MQKLKRLWKYPYIIFFIFAFVWFYGGITNFHSSILLKDYIKVEGTVCNLETEQVKQNHGYVTRYNYDIVWYDDGEEYIKHLEHQVDYVAEGTKTIWVHPDNKDAVLFDSVTIGKDVPKFLIKALICAVIGIVLFEIKRRTRRENQAERDERLEDAKIYGILTMLCVVVGSIAFGVKCYLDYKQGEYISPTIWDVYIVVGIVGFIGLGVYLRAAKQLKDG